MIPHIENGEACIVVAISTEGRKAAAEIMGTVSLGNKSIKGVAKVREANNNKSPMQMFMEQTPKLIIPEYDIRKTESVNGHKVKVEIRGNDISIPVDGSYERGDISPQDGKRVALQALRMVQSEVAKMPDGTLLENSPSTGDGLGEGRVSLYMRAGFGSPDQNDPPDGRRMRAVVKKGKLTPISAEQHRYLMNNRHYNSLF